MNGAGWFGVRVGAFAEVDPAGIHVHNGMLMG